MDAIFRKTGFTNQTFLMNEPRWYTSMSSMGSLQLTNLELKVNGVHTKNTCGTWESTLILWVTSSMKLRYCHYSLSVKIRKSNTKTISKKVLHILVVYITINMKITLVLRSYLLFMLMEKITKLKNLLSIMWWLILLITIMQQYHQSPSLLRKPRLQTLTFTTSAITLIRLMKSHMK